VGFLYICVRASGVSGEHACMDSSGIPGDLVPHLSTQDSIPMLCNSIIEFWVDHACAEFKLFWEDPLVPSHVRTDSCPCPCTCTYLNTEVHSLSVPS